MKPLYTKIILSSIGLVLVYVLFLLPKVVVNDKPVSTKEVNRTEDDPTIPEEHLAISVEQQQIIDSYKQKLDKATNSNLFAIFADSLSLVFYDLQQFDSAVAYKELIYNKIPSQQHKKAYANMLFEATENYPPGKGIVFAKRAKPLYAELSNDYPEVETFKVKHAVLIVKTNAAEGIPPIEGINILKEVISNNPSNILANRHLGEFYMEIGTSDPKMLTKATIYFENILKIDPQNIRALINLLETSIAMEKKEKARHYHLQLTELINKEDKFLTDYLSKKNAEINNL